MLNSDSKEYICGYNQTHKPYISITVPIFNAERDLPRCLNSLIKQTLKNIEIILVDDGSTDNCGKICDEYARIDSRIKVFHKKNGGSGDARQVGLEKSNGEYYTVCDADDWVEPNMYAELYNKAKTEDADIVLSNHYINYPNRKQIESPVYKYQNQEQYILDLMYSKAFPSTWNKLFKLETIRKFKVMYKSGINLGEDALFLYKILLNPVKIVDIPQSFYHYQRNINSYSYTNNITQKSIEQSKYILDWKQKYFIDKKYTRAHKYSTINLAFTTIRANDVDREFFKLIVQDVSFVDIVKYRLLSVKAILIIATKVFGLSFGRSTYRLLYKFFYR